MVAQREVEEVSDRWQFCSTDNTKRCAWLVVNLDHSLLAPIS